CDTPQTAKSIASLFQSDKTNPEESDPNSASIITSPTQSLENHESIEQAIKTLEEKIKLDQHEHAIRILLRQLQQPEYKNETVDDDSSTVSKKKPVRTNKLAGTFPKSRPQSGFYSYNNNSQRSQTIIERKTPIVSTLPAKNLCTCRDPDSFWCRVCENRRFKAAFPKWTSGNKIIDAFIQETQLTTAGPFNYLEWIPFDKFRYIKSLGEGGYGSLSTATWLEGPRSLQDEKMRTKWKRDIRKKVVLKFLRNSEHITQEYLKSLHRTLHDWARKIIETPKLPYKVNTEFAVAEQWRIRRHSPATTEVIHQKAKYTSQLFDFRELNIPDMEEMACEISHSEHAQSQQPAAESNTPPNHDTINQKTPSKEHVEIEF
ncbi:15728_t:CDS:2, partial [Funneliformis caledonium]